MALLVVLGDHVVAQHSREGAPGGPGGLRALLGDAVYVEGSVDDAEQLYRFFARSPPSAVLS